MPRGGSRKHASDCKCGNCPKPGRKKTERPTNANIAAKVLAEAKAEKLWLKIIKTELDQIDATPLRASTTSLRETLKYLENRAYGNCVDTVNHLHKEPIQMNHTLELGEGMRLAMQKAEERVRTRK